MAKKILILAVVLIMSLGIFGGCGGVELKQGVYVADNEMAKVILSDDNEFAFVRHRATIYCPTGKYSIKKGQLILHAADDEEYVFDIKDGQLIFVRSIGIESLVETGTLFKLSENDI